jgi:hypothetical protein
MGLSVGQPNIHTPYTDSRPLSLDVDPPYPDADRSDAKLKTRYSPDASEYGLLPPDSDTSMFQAYGNGIDAGKQSLTHAPWDTLQEKASGSNTSIICESTADSPVICSGIKAIDAYDTSYAACRSASIAPGGGGPSDAVRAIHWALWDMDGDGIVKGSPETDLNKPVPTLPNAWCPVCHNMTWDSNRGTCVSN